MRKKKAGKQACILVFILLNIIPVQAQDNDENVFRTSTELVLQVSSLPEAKLALNQRFIFPFLNGSGPLVKDNNLTALLSAEISPVSMNGIGELIWTPVAFFMLSGGGQAGSGWNIALGDGMGINAPEDETLPNDPPRKAKISGDPLDGLVWRAWSAGTLQFDLAAIVPGDWNHILFQTRHEFRYSGYTRAEPGDLWIYEADEAENQNGWLYYANYVLGYYMPQSPVLDTIAFMAEINKSLYNSPGGDFWGESLGRWIFSGLFNFSIHPKFSTALIIQMRTRRNFGSRNIYTSDYYYKDLELEGDNGQRRVLFYRAAVILTYKIH